MEICLRDSTENVKKATGYEGGIEWGVSRPNGQPRRMLDVARAKERFGFSARTTLDEGLRKTIAWYRQHRLDIAQQEALRKRA